MTSINLAVQLKARAAFIISDGAVTDEAGILLRNEPKIIHGAGRFPWAMGVTGNVPAAVIHRHIAAANPLTLKQLAKRLPGAMRAAVTETAQTLSRAESGVLLKLLGAMWDFTNKRPEGFVIASQSGTTAGQDLEPYVWHTLAWSVGSYHPDGVAGFLGRAADLTDPGSFDPEADGLALITAQRSYPMQNVTPGCEEGHCRIGGDVDLTEVTKRGVRVWKIHEFRDRVGYRLTA